MQHFVQIKWGQASPGEGRNIERFQFDTREELNAFMEGVAAANGWMGYEIMEDSRDQQDPNEPLPL